MTLFTDHFIMPRYRRRALSLGDRASIAAWRLATTRYPSLAKRTWLPGAISAIGGLASYYGPRAYSYIKSKFGSASRAGRFGFFRRRRWRPYRRFVSY